MEKGRFRLFRSGFDGWSLLVAVIILVGAILRIYKAWLIQFTANSDCGIVAIMAKHMAEGTDFPVFFYGQPYMGSLEPAVSAILCKLFGVSPFMVCLGTALVGILLLPLVYVWARGAGGKRAGLIALLLCVVGTDTNLHYSVAPRGGYMTMMVCGVFAVYLACRISLLLAQGQRVHIGYYLGLGLSAGLGWWSNQLIIVYLATAAFIMLLGFSWRMVVYGLIPALLAFFAGSAPWWIWNANHEWATFGFGETLGRVAFGKGFHALVGTFLRTMELSALNNWWNDICLAVFVIMLVLFLALLINKTTRREHSDMFFFRIAAPMVIVLLILVSVTSHFILFGGNTRYLLPMLPAIAVMLGVSVDWLMQRFGSVPGWIMVAVLMPGHLYTLPRMNSDFAAEQKSWKEVKQIADAAGPLCDGVCIGEYGVHWMNFASDEKLCVATLPWERYAPYARRAELAKRPAVINDYCGLRSFLSYTGGKSQQFSLDRVTLDYAITPPPDDWDYVDVSAIAGIHDDKGVSCKAALTDWTMSTLWKVSLEKKQKSGLTIEFARPVPLCGIRYISLDNRPPSLLEIECQSGGSTNWQPLLPPIKAAGYFWSGPYIKLEGSQVYEENRFTAPTGGITRLRLNLRVEETRPQTICLDEILLMEKVTSIEKTLPTSGECLAALKLHGVKQFFGPRWMAERVAVDAEDSTSSAITIRAPSFVKRAIQELPGRDSDRAAQIDFTEKTVLMMDLRDAPRSREVLRKCGHKWEEVVIGSHVLMVVARATSDNDWLNYVPVYWTEQGCFVQEMSRTMKKRAELVYRQALEQKAAGNLARMRESLGKAVSLYAWHQAARRELINALESSGQKAEAAAQKAVLDAQTVPAVSGHIRFPQGVEFVGLTLSSNEITRGQEFEVTYFWKCATNVNTAMLAAFVHFKKGKECFQDDHILMEDVLRESLEYQPFQEIFSYKRRMMVPASVPTGDYQVVVGLLDRKDNRRLKPQTDLKQKKMAVELPFSLKVK